MQFVGGDLVRDHFVGLGNGLADGAPHALEYAPNFFGLRSDVLVNGFKVGLGHSSDYEELSHWIEMRRVSKAQSGTSSMSIPYLPHPVRYAKYRPWMTR